jgi:hypothetical protein
VVQDAGADDAATDDDDLSRRLHSTLLTKTDPAASLPSVTQRRAPARDLGREAMIR